MMASCSLPKFEAIQIVKSVKKQEGQVIKVIEKHGSGPNLQDILCKENKKVPVFVISICGKTRTGKSFLLNLMIKYLESKGLEDWTDGPLPSVFEWKGGIESVTRGLWICPKVFKLRNQSGKEVGILLMDNQGLFDGEQSDGVSVAISGISTILSHYQIFNLKDKIGDNDLECIWRHLISDESDLSDSSTAKLVFTVRDYLGQDEGCGLDHGKAYMDGEKIRGSQAHRDMWEGLCKAFPEIICLLLPYPGDKVRRGKVEFMKDIEPSFLEEVELFFKKIFDPKSLNDTKNTSTGEQVYKTLKNFDEKEADESLSFMNVFTEQGNQAKLDLLMTNFESRLGSLEFRQSSSGQLLIVEFMSTAKKQFKGNSTGDYLLKLETFMVQKINGAVKHLILEKYRNALDHSSNATYTHPLEWGSVKTKLNFFVGSEAEKNELKEEVILSCAKTYYIILRKQLATRFESYANYKTLEGLEGYDEDFVSKEFKENIDFMAETPLKQRACHAEWLKEKEVLRTDVQNKLLMYVAALTDNKIDIDWLKNSVSTQFKFYEIFTWKDDHFIEIKKNDDNLFELVGYTMYKEAKKLHEYSKEQREEIERVSDKIKSISTSYSIKLTCIFILYVHEKKESCDPVFKVINESGCIFIDTKGRTYKNWTVFKEDNQLPDCLYCYPSNGEYNKKQGFRVGFTWSPASSFGKKFWKVLDVAAKVVAVGAVGAIGAVVAFPAATVAAIGGAVAAGASGAYGIGRRIVKIVDKVQHDESIGATDVVDVVANGLSVITAGATAGAVLLTTIGKELACAPAIIQGVTSLTSLVFQLDTDNISYLSLANDISMFLLFNSKSIEGALKNIRSSYHLPSSMSNLEILEDFISRNSITLPKSDGERLTTGQFLSENLKSLLLTAIVNKSELRPLQFLKETVADSEDLRPLRNLFGEASHIEEQVRFFGELIKCIGKIIQNKRNPISHDHNPSLIPILHNGIGYLSSTEVKNEVAMTGVCMGLNRIEECSDEDCVQLLCSITREILKLVYENTKSTNLKGMTAYLETNGEIVVRKILEMY